MPDRRVKGEASPGKPALDPPMRDRGGRGAVMKA